MYVYAQLGFLTRLQGTRQLVRTHVPLPGESSGPALSVRESCEGLKYDSTGTYCMFCIWKLLFSRALYLISSDLL